MTAFQDNVSELATYTSISMAPIARFIKALREGLADISPGKTSLGGRS